MAVNGQNLLSSALDLPKSMWKRLRNKRSNMTSKDYRDFAVEQMGLLEGICTKPMMGEYLLYWQGEYFGQDQREIRDAGGDSLRGGQGDVSSQHRQPGGSGGGHQGYLRGTEIDRCTKIADGKFNDYIINEYSGICWR